MQSSITWKDEFEEIEFDFFNSRQWCEFFKWDHLDRIKVSTGGGMVDMTLEDYFSEKTKQSFTTATIRIEMPNAWVSYFFTFGESKAIASTIRLKTFHHPDDILKDFDDRLNYAQAKREVLEETINFMTEDLREKLSIVNADICEVKTLIKKEEKREGII